MKEESKVYIKEEDINIKSNSRYETKNLCIKCGRIVPTNFQYCPKCNVKLWPIPTHRE